MGRLLHRLSRKPALAERDFRLLCTDTFGFSVGMGGELLLISLLVFEFTGSSAWVGIAIALYFGPQIVVGTIAGAFADWLPRRTLMRAAQLSLGVNLSLIGLLAGFDDLEVWQILTVSIVSGTIRAVYQPVRLSFAYDLVGREDAISGLALMQLVNLIGQGAGALITGSAMQRLGPAHAYGLLACMHLAGFIILGSIRAAGGSSASGERESLGQTFRNYAREVRANRVLLALVIVTGAVNLFGFTFVVVLPELATGRWGVGAEGLGILHAARAAGGMLAMGAVALWGSGTRHGEFFIVVIFSFGASLCALGFAPTYAFACAVLLLVAAMAALSDVLSQGMMQHCVADRLRGRAMGAWMFAVGLSPMGQLELGALAAWWGADVALASSGIALIACGVATRLVSRVRSL